jgi:hypothetical protein
MSVELGALHFSRITFERLEDGIHPHLKCPKCKREWTSALSLGTSFPATFDFNRKVNFTVPTHKNPATDEECGLSNAKISWFIAVHRDENGLQLCIQRSDAEGANEIPTDWWKQV